MRPVRALAAVVLTSAALLVPSGLGASARAATTSGWASWTPISGRSNDYRTTMQLPAAGFPEASVHSDSRSNVQLPGGTSSFLGGAGDSVPTRVGREYGSSRGRSYLVLRPLADTPTTPSTTTYTFAAPTPATGWTFVLGDVDADQVRIEAKDADGTELSPAQIDGWYRDSFNYAGDADRPTWRSATATLVGNPQALDTDGAAAWFEPDVRLSALTFVFTRRAGFPVYQTWFATHARSITATVHDVSTGGRSCPLDQVTLTLTGPTGEVLATRPATGGTVDFGQFATQDGYTVTLDAPATCALVGDAQQPVSTATGDGSASFDVRAVRPFLATGRVVDTAGQPVEGVELTLTPPVGTPRTTTTDTGGDWAFDNNQTGSNYSVAVTGIPDGYVLVSANSETFDVTTGPVTVPNFVLRELPAVTGTIRDGGVGVGGVTVTLTPSGGTPVTTVTEPDGTYRFAHVPGGTYEISVTPPDGDNPVAPRTGVQVGTVDVTDQDFALSRPGAVGGTVRDATTGLPVPDATVTVTSGGTTHVLQTDARGDYFLEGLPAGDYELTLSVPAGDTASGPTSRSVTITSAGEIRSQQNFAIVRRFAVSGTVSGPDGPVAGAEVVAETGTASRATPTGPDGTYTVPHLLPGGYTIAVIPPDGLQPAGSGRRHITVGGAPVSGIDFTLRAGGPSSQSPPSSVSPPTSQPVSSASAPGGGAPSSATTSGDTGSGSLADTGAPVYLSAAGALLVLVGACAALAGRRRRRSH